MNHALIAAIAQSAGMWSAPRLADVFHSTVFTTVSGPRTMNIGIDLAAHGGMVWERDRDPSDQYHSFIDSVRGMKKWILPTSPAVEGTDEEYIDSFTSTGYTLPGPGHWTGHPIAAYTFRRAPRFFDVLGYTGNGATGRHITHGLGAEVGMIWIKSRDVEADWVVWHRSLDADESFLLNFTDDYGAEIITEDTVFNDERPTTERFTVSGTDAWINQNGANYVAYLFAHDPSPSGIVHCGEFVADGNGLKHVDLGWRPQTLITKRKTNAGAIYRDWNVLDVQRGWSDAATNPGAPYQSNAEAIRLNTIAGGVSVKTGMHTATGFYVHPDHNAVPGESFVFMAIRGG